MLTRAGWLVVVLLGSLVGCYSPIFGDCGIACTDDSGCPSETSCKNGFCAHAGTPSCKNGAGPPDMHAPDMAMHDDLAQPCVAPTNPSEVWVDAKGPDGGVGKVTCPFQRVTDGIAAATASTASGVVVHVAAGKYGAKESFPLRLRNGVSLDGAGAADTVIMGLGTLDRRTDGGGQFNQIYSVTLLVGDSNASATSILSNLTLSSGIENGDPSYIGILCDQGNTPLASLPPPQVFPAPNVIINKATIGPGYGYGAVVTNSDKPQNLPGCNMQVTGSTFQGNQLGIFAVGCGLGVVQITTALRVGGSGMGEGNTFTNERMYSGGYGTGVGVWDCVAPLSIVNNMFTDSDGGVSLPLYVYKGELARFVDIEGNSFQNLSAFGLALTQEAIVDKLINNSFTNISAPNGTARAIWLQSHSPTAQPPQIVLARGNVIAGNDVGIFWEGPSLIGPDTLLSLHSDFGTAASPGNNTFACNSVLGAGVGGDLVFNVGAAAGASPIPFIGNSWDHKPPHASVAASATNGQDIIFPSGSVASLVQTGSDQMAASCMGQRLPGP